MCIYKNIYHCALGLVPNLNGARGEHTSQQSNIFRTQHEYFKQCLVSVYLMTQLIQMPPMIKNSFYLLDACLLFIPATAYINSQNESVCVRMCICLWGYLWGVQTHGDKWRLALCFLQSPFEWVTCVAQSERAHVHVLVLVRLCVSVCMA